MKTMKKIVAILAVAMLLCSMLPLSVMAAAGDTHVVSFSSISGSVQYADETHDLGGGISLHITKCHINTQLRIYSSSSNNGIATFTSEQPIASFVMNAGYKADTVNVYTSTDGSTWTLDQGIAVASSYKDYTVNLAAPSKYIQLDVKGTQQVRIAKMTFTFGEEASSGCDHANLTCGETCSNCGEYTKEHKFSNTCVEVCENGCGTANPDYVAGHSYIGTYDATCDICNAIREVSFPEADSTLTIPEIIEICGGMDSGATTSAKYYVSGEVTEIYNTTYGNMYITDGENTLTIYGTYDADGTNRFDAMAEQPEVGNTVTLYGKIGPYNGTAQMQYAWITEIVSDCEHEYEFECSTTCQLCGKGLREAECVTNAQYACVDGLCIYCGGDVAALEHDFDDEWDADCNYGCGYTREVEEKPDITEATLDFSTTDQRTEYSTTVQVWANGALVLTNNKGGSTSNVGNYSNPARFYKGSEVIVAYPGMTSLVIDCSNAGDSKYITPWAATLEAAGLSYTEADGVYTITFAAPVDSITLTTTAQVRANSITATAVKTGDDECVHEWVDATCTAPKTCSICGAVEGVVLDHEWEIISQEEATCTAAGSITYECSGCGEDQAETFPALPHTYVDGICSGCGAELPLEATITFGEDKAQRTEFTTELQKWEHDGLVLINNKGESTNNIGDYAGRCYKGSEIIISFPGMTSLVIDANGIGSDYLWDATLADYTFTKADGVYTITFAEPTDSITLTAANQVRANKITASRVVACAHEYDNACDVDCNLCYEAREVQHSVQHVEAKAATCAANGNIEYWYCDVCGMAWLNAECTMNTNLRAVVLPATGEHTYFDACSAICEVCGFEREVSHNIVHVEAVAATCAANGNLEYWYCDVCGMAWLNAECTLNTNLRAVVLPATGEHTYDDEYDADCNVCGDVREVPEKPVEIVYGDANGDGAVNNIDVALLQQYIAGYDVTLEEVSADANGDGAVNNIDVALLQQYIAGYDVTLGPVDDENKLFNDGELTIW